MKSNSGERSESVSSSYHTTYHFRWLQGWCDFFKRQIGVSHSGRTAQISKRLGEANLISPSRFFSPRMYFEICCECIHALTTRLAKRMAAPRTTQISRWPLQLLPAHTALDSWNPCRPIHQTCSCPIQYCSPTPRKKIYLSYRPFSSFPACFIIQIRTLPRPLWPNLVRVRLHEHPRRRAEGPGAQDHPVRERPRCHCLHDLPV